MSQWEDLASRQPRDDTANFNIPILGQFKKDRFVNNEGSQPKVITDASFNPDMISPSRTTPTSR